ncbi:hypothetical protein CEE36_06700 [candidate division TA06 bacterium B3_TA06]|uniref:Uncharacterized protein n=1 Tax=candidate division TA06 bacterium B3_TA06 TaxID=2012487 RepID=A0A532V727_UNCT6|nr:MAG: hypothetical protein CEE36_06700 [candidate division TA06 bacterium B3_TA06]
MFEEGLTPHMSAAQPCGDPSILLLACGEKIGEMNFLPRPDTSCLVGDPRRKINKQVRSFCLRQKGAF